MTGRYRIRRERGSRWLHSCVFGYLRPASSIHVGADGVVGARPTHIQVGPVPRLDQTDEVPAFPLREGMTKPDRVGNLETKKTNPFMMVVEEEPDDAHSNGCLSCV